MFGDRKPQALVRCGVVVLGLRDENSRLIGPTDVTTTFIDDAVNIQAEEKVFYRVRRQE